MQNQINQIKSFDINSYYGDMLKQVVFTNLTFDKPSLDLKNRKNFIYLEQQAFLVKEEMDELFEAKNLNDIRDAISDINVTNLGLCHLANLKLSENLNLHISFIKNITSIYELMKLEQAKIFDSISKQNLEQLHDSVSLIHLYNHYVSQHHGIDDQKDMFAVFKSNLSKVCQTKEDSDITLEKYQSMGVKVHSLPCPTILGFIIKVSEDCYDNNKKFYPKNKFLKCSISFKEPIFEPLNHKTSIKI